MKSAGPRFVAACGLALAALTAWGVVDWYVRSRRWRRSRGLWLEA